MTRRTQRATRFPYTTLFRSKNKRTGEYVGGGAILGAIIGGIAGGGKGAAIGAGAGAAAGAGAQVLTKGNRSEEHTSELQSLRHLVCRLLLEKKKATTHKRQN